MPRRLRVGAALITGLVAMSPSACTSDDGGGETPAEFARAQGARVEVAYPKGWQNAGPAGKGYAVAVRDPSNVATVSVQENLSQRGNEDLLAEIVEAGNQAQSTGYRRTGTKPIKVAGAQAATRVEYTYLAKLTDAGQADNPAQGVDVAVMDQQNRVHAVRVTWLKNKLDAKTIDKIISSIKVR